MRGLVWIVIQLALLCAPALVCASDAPLMAFMSPRAQTNVLRAPAPGALAQRGPQVSADHAVKRLMHHCDSAGVPEMCGMDALVHLEVDSLDSKSFTKLMGNQPLSLRKRVLESQYQMVLPAMDQSESSFGESLLKAIHAQCSGWRTASRLADADAEQPTLFKISTSNLQEKESDITATLLELDEAYPSHVVVVSAAQPHMLNKRRIPVKPEQLQSHGKFLERYQLFNTTTVLSIGVASLLIFFSLIAVMMIAGTESPDKLGAKTGVSQEKKRQ